MSSITCSLFFHNYYGRHAEWINFFSEKIRIPFTLYYNIVEDSIYNLQYQTLRLAGRDGGPSLQASKGSSLEDGQVEEDWGATQNARGASSMLQQLHQKLTACITGPYLQKIILRSSPNQGKDIGGKLVLMDTFLQLSSESPYIAFLHDKTSPHKAGGEEWTKKLFGIIEPAFVENAIRTFESNKDIGIIAGPENISNEYDAATQDFTSTNAVQLKLLLKDFNIELPEYSYVAGAMFWIRSAPLLKFFRQHAPLDIRKTLEKGNIMDETSGTMTHAWERFICWLIIAQGYRIKGLSC